MLTLCDGKGMDYEAEIENITADCIECGIVKKQKSNSEPDIKVTLAQGIPKAAKMDYIIQKTTELGISRIIPCTLARCVVKLENRKAEEKRPNAGKKSAKKRQNSPDAALYQR